MDLNADWQLTRHNIKERGKYIFENGKWSDCNFLVGNESNQEIVPGHKLILAMSSPVFEAMFFGGLAEKNDPIPILDVQPDAFKALLEYIYTDNISINSFDKACEMCYGAKKYMLPHVVERCTKFLWADLSPKNACRAYEFAKLFEEPLLQEKSLQIICKKTMEVLTDPSFEDIELETFIEIVNLECLNIDSELDLFFALTRYVDKHNEKNCESLDSSLAGTRQASPMPSQSNDTEILNIKNNIELKNNEVLPCSSKENVESDCLFDQNNLQENQEKLNHENVKDDQKNWRSVLKKIRFLTLTPQQFAEGPGKSNLLEQNEAFSILMNISSINSGCPMPDGFTKNRNARDQQDNGEFFTPEKMYFRPSERPRLEENRDVVETRKHYCVRTTRQQTECLNTSVLDCSVTFSVDRSICITGIQVPTQVFGGNNMQNHRFISERYSEVLYAHLLDNCGARLTYTHSTPSVRFDSLMEISFDRPVFIQARRMYKIGVVFNKVGWYPMCTCAPSVTCDNVTFSFGIGDQNESIRDGLIRSIVFTYTRDGV